MRRLTAVGLVAGGVLAVLLVAAGAPRGAAAQTGQDRLVVFETSGREA